MVRKEDVHISQVLLLQQFEDVIDRLEMARKAGVPTSQVLVLLQFEDVIDELWLK